MEKSLSTLGYWLGLICTVLAVIFRLLAAFRIYVLHMGNPGVTAISYLTFFHAAALFFLLAIASWCQISRS
jgi:hypothetical protein